MRKLLAVATALAFVFAAGTILAEPPKQVVFETKQGNVTFDHAKHLAAAKTSCAACHVAGGAAFETKGNCQKCHVKS